MSELKTLPAAQAYRKLLSKYGETLNIEFDNMQSGRRQKRMSAKEGALWDSFRKHSGYALFSYSYRYCWNSALPMFKDTDLFPVDIIELTQFALTPHPKTESSVRWLLSHKVKDLMDWSLVSVGEIAEVFNREYQMCEIMAQGNLMGGWKGALLERFREVCRPYEALLWMSAMEHRLNAVEPNPTDADSIAAIEKLVDMASKYSYADANRLFSRGIWDMKDEKAAAMMTVDGDLFNSLLSLGTTV
jgi:hypothetical protein